MGNKLAFIILVLSILLLLLNVYNGIQSNDFNTMSILSNLLLIVAMAGVIYSNKKHRP